MKRFSISLLALALCAVFVGCATQEEMSVTSESATPAQRQVLPNANTPAY
jgi:hypothetical protein